MRILQFILNSFLRIDSAKAGYAIENVRDLTINWIIKNIKTQNMTAKYLGVK